MDFSHVAINSDILLKNTTMLTMLSKESIFGDWENPDAKKKHKFDNAIKRVYIW